jgi:hypothetical protein
VNKKQNQTIMRATILTLFTVLLSFGLWGQTYELKSFDMTISGTSTLHDWVSSVTKINSDVQVQWKDGRLATIDKLIIRIPAESIISTKGRIMDNKTYEALKSEEHPNIRFQLKTADVVYKEGNYTIQSTGLLTIAGQSKTIRLTANAQPIAGGGLTFTGAYTLKMTDYGIEPPTALMGSIKTGDEITIDYSLSLSPQANN